MSTRQTIPGRPSLKIAFITPELAPLVRRTQLADFSQALTQALGRVGADVRVFMPRTEPVFDDVLAGISEVGVVEVEDGQGKVEFRISCGQLEGVPVYLMENEEFFGSRNPYGGDEGPYPDNWRRYELFARAVLAAQEVVKFTPDILHCVDWATGLVPLIHRHEYTGAKRRKGKLHRAGTYFQIQNLAIQGAFERDVLPHMGLPHSMFTSPTGLELNGKVNFLKAGCENATILGTHSPGHAERIQQQDRGYGLEGLFRRRHKELIGISNGIDYATWDPATDPLLPQPYSAKDKTPNGKKRAKTALQAALGLDKGPRTPLIAMIGRFDSDSGFEILAEMLTPILERNIEVVLMGAGRPDIHERLKTMETTFAGRCRVIEGYQLNTAHAIMGGADILLLPSHYAPGNALCAIGMRYGVVPIIYGGSGLEDYVIDLETNPRGGTGFHFQNYSGEGLLEGIDSARKLYRNATAWKTVTSRCLRQDFSWAATAAEYLKAYRRVTRRVRPSKKSA